VSGDAGQNVDPNERVEVSLILRPRRPLPDAAELERPLTREEFAAAYGASPSDQSAVEEFGRKHGLEVVESSPARRTVRLAGRADAVANAFGVQLRRVRLEDGQVYRMPSGEARLPPGVEGVFGLDTRPIARPRGEA
jgi:kumamolisin